MPDDLASTLRDVDPAVLGARIKAARVRAGLTQSALAADDVSVGFVSRIEGGHRRPDADLLVKIADRLSVTTDELLLGVATDHLAELRLTLDHAELALVTGSAADALTKVVGVLDDPACTELPELHRRARRLQAGALEATGDLQAAILLLEDLAASPPHDLEWIDDLTALCRCYRESGELARAVSVGNDARQRIEELGLDGLQESIRLTLTLAAACSEQGDVNYAARLCARAVEQAEGLGSATAKAMAYWNSSAVELVRGNAAAALPLARRALAVLEAAEDARNLARLRTQVGILHLQQDPPQPREALDLLAHAAGELEMSDAGTADAVDNDLAQARARFLLGDLDTARRQAVATMNAVGDALASGTPILAADALALLGELALSEDDLDGARRHFNEAVMLLSGVGADRFAAQRWYDLAVLFEEMDDQAAALDAFRRAGAASGLVKPASRQRVRADSVASRSVGR